MHRTHIEQPEKYAGRARALTGFLSPAGSQYGFDLYRPEYAGGKVRLDFQPFKKMAMGTGLLQLQLEIDHKEIAA